MKDYDYTATGYYFVTICIQNRECIFGDIINGEITLNEIGEIARQCWKDIPEHFTNVELDWYVIMPNHVHGIIIIENHRRGVKFNAPTNNNSQYHSETYSDERIENVGVQNFEPLRNNPKPKIHRYQYIIPGSIGSIIRSFKSAVTRWCGKNSFRNFRWQRNFYDHIIRNKNELFHIRQYMINNPLNWHLDNHHPINSEMNGL